jgi:hypothetical protein
MYTKAKIELKKYICEYKRTKKIRKYKNVKDRHKNVLRTYYISSYICKYSIYSPLVIEC